VSAKVAAIGIAKNGHYIIATVHARRDGSRCEAGLRISIGQQDSTVIPAVQARG
jgi:hypothetical protein